MFTKGQTVVCKKVSWVSDSPDLTIGKEYVVDSVHGVGIKVVNDRLDIVHYFNDRFEAKVMKHTFKVNDTVLSLENIPPFLTKNKTYKVVNINYEGIYVVDDVGVSRYYLAHRFELYTHKELDKKDYKNIRVGDRILFLGDKGMSYIEMEVKEIADDGKAIKNKYGSWYRVSYLNGDSMNFKEILPKQ